MIDPETLKVVALIDWEHAGFFPQGMERWRGALADDAYIARGTKIADAIGEFLAEEYLECYREWPEKAELEPLIRGGRLPHPDQIKAAETSEN